MIPHHAAPVASRGNLDPTSRRAALQAMAENVVDVLVVGGGIVGAGAALDATSRGLSTALVEARDWASGTSSRSSRLIHGGLRYLEMREFGLVREALRERALLLERIAPHLVRPVQFLYPLTRPWRERPYVGAGLLLYDAMARKAPGGRLPGHRHLGKRTALSTFPALSSRRLVGAISYWDAQVDDARYTLAVVRTAAALGALVANRAQVTALRRDGRATLCASVLDTETGDRLDVRANHVVLAAGPWTDELLSLALPGTTQRVRPSKGVHLVVGRDRITGSCALIARTDRSVLFVIPWDEHWLIGTTDTEWTHGPTHVVATASDISYLLDQLNPLLACPVRRHDILGVYAGLRPLARSGPGATTRLSREHQISQPLPGLTVVTGGKFTTYRIMAREAIDAATRASAEGAPPSRTAELPLLGSSDPRAWERYCLDLARRPAMAGFTSRDISRLVARYGTQADALASLIEETPRLKERLPGGTAHLAAEVVYAVRAEGAMHLEDVLQRRTHIALECTDGVGDAAQEVAALLGAELGWSSSRRQAEITSWRASLHATRAARETPGDAEALAAAKYVLDGVHAAGHSPGAWAPAAAASFPQPDAPVNRQRTTR